MNMCPHCGQDCPRVEVLGTVWSKLLQKFVAVLRFTCHKCGYQWDEDVDIEGG